MPKQRKGGTGLVLRSRILLRRNLDTAQAAWRWRRLSFSDLPIVFGNAVPKGGSHLLLQILQGLREAAHFASVEPEPIRTITQFERRWRSSDEIIADIRRLRPGHMGWGYLFATPENLAVLGEPGRVNYFVFRDPRDVMVSSVYFARDKYPGHDFHEYYNRLGNFGACLRVEIAGIQEGDLHLPSIRTRYERYFAFLDTNTMYPVRFEDLINRRQEAIAGMLDFYQSKGPALPQSLEESIRIISQAIQPGKSSTFRKGEPGNWREHFNAENKSLFKEVAGDLLIHLGYEKDNDW
jgi:hypothetical protein